MSGDYHYVTTSTSSNKGRYPVDEDVDDRLWQDFEANAQAVARLYKDPTWKCLQTAAASTTQLYKTSVDNHRRGYEKGLSAGRAAMAKEVLSALSSGKGDFNINILLKLLYDNISLGMNETQNNRPAPGITSETVAALRLFQQALTPSQPTAPSRTSDLNSFLSNQVQRRKRQRSPSSPSSLIKKLKRS